MTIDATADPLPLAPFIHIGPNGPELVGKKCSQCAEVFTSGALACPKCGALNSLQDVRLAQTGRLYTYTIVQRSFPGIETPFISAIARLDDGAFIKGNLVDVPADPKAITFDLPVRVEFRAMAAPDGGAEVIRHVFAPMQQGGAHV